MKLIRTSTPLHGSAPGGLFLSFYWLPFLMIYDKPAKSVEDLLSFLEGKGLIIEDRELAIQSLLYIGYYRLKIYTRYFECEDRAFYEGTKFKDILNLYDFDRGLRLICLDAIERVEVALRAQLINAMACYAGPHFYENQRYFEERWGCEKTLGIVDKAEHLSISHYKRKYTSPERPPIWCVTEAISFGDLSRVYADLKLVSRAEVAKGFGLDQKVLVSWFKSLATLRNICAHHERLWNADLVVDAPKIAKAYRVDLANNKSFYSRVVMLFILLGKINSEMALRWRDDLVGHIELFEDVDLADAGFPSDWLGRDLWRSGAVPLDAIRS